MIELKVIKGTAAFWQIQGRNRLTGDVPAVFLATDAVSARVWPGDDRAVAFAPAASWTDAATCQVRVSVADADTADVEPGGYRCQVLVDRAGVTVPIAETIFTVLPAPGAAEALPVYCTAEDLRRECTWIDRVLDASQDQSGFAEQRAAAREWFDGLILGGRPADGWSARYPGLATWGGGGGLISDPWLAGVLAAGGLMLTGPRGRKAVRANVYHALASIFRTRCGPGDKLAGYASMYARMADNTAKGSVVEIDADLDGVAEIAVPLCVSNTLRG